jgi:class 3 adenylate cyclase
LERYGRGIDNAHIDVYLSPRLRDRVRETVRKLILGDIQSQLRQTPQGLIDAKDLNAFRESYLGMFDAISLQTEERISADRLALLRMSLLKCLLQAVASERDGLQQEIKNASNEDKVRASGRNLEMHEHLVGLTRGEHALNRRVLRFLFRQIQRLEGAQAQKIRTSLVGEAWPFPQRAFFNPVLLFPDLGLVGDLIPDYPIARLGEGGDTDWLFHTNQCVSTVFQHYLPAWTRMPARYYRADSASDAVARERRDQGLLKGFLGTEMLLSRFVPKEEYRSGRCSWLDDPSNLRLFLASARDSSDSPDSGFAQSRESEFADSLFSGRSEIAVDHPVQWSQAGWQGFQTAVVTELFRCLDLNALGTRVVLLYWLPVIGRKLGRPAPLSLVVDFVEGRLPRRRLAQRLEALSLGLDSASVARTLERATVQLKRLGRFERSRFLSRYLTDFLVLRRDLKLAYKSYEAMDGIRLLEDPHDVQLSRANSSLHSFSCGEEQRPASRRILAHAVIKADVRGSTNITERLRAKGLNPASHFELNFFGPVNRLLPELGAEKLFVEGDAVILGLFEYEGEPTALAVARACALARKILQVVFLQNAVNRKHGLPELELGLGISFSDREPNFLYDEGHRIMISEAINRADRLSGSASALRTAGFQPESQAFRVDVVIDRSTERSAVQGDVVLDYNVNGVKLEKAAFFKLQKEIRLHQVRLAEEEFEDNLFFAGRFADLAGREHWLVLRYAAVREWDGQSLGPVDPDRTHFFELIVDEALSVRVRKLAEGSESLPLRGRG